MQIGGMDHANVNSFNSFAVNERRWCCPALCGCAHRWFIAILWREPKYTPGGARLGKGQQTPPARAEDPVKPGLTPGWSDEGSSASSRRRVSSPFAVAALGWAKFTPNWAADRLIKDLGFNLLSLGDPGVAFKVNFFTFSICGGGYRCPWAHPANTAAATRLPRQHSILTALAFNANGHWWVATRQFLSQILNLFIPSSGLELQGRGKKVSAVLP